MTDEKKDETPEELPNEDRLLDEAAREAPQEPETPAEEPTEEAEPEETPEEEPKEESATEEMSEPESPEPAEEPEEASEPEAPEPAEPEPEATPDKEVAPEEPPAPESTDTTEAPESGSDEAGVPPEDEQQSHIFALRTTANREDQVLSFVGSNAARKKIPVYAAISPHGMRGYIFLEAADIISAEQAAQGVPYAKGVIPKEIEYKEIEHMLEQVKKDIKIQKNDIVEIIAGPFKREQAKISRVDKAKEEVVVELLEAAVPIPITLKLDDVKVIRREEE